MGNLWLHALYVLLMLLSFLPIYLLSLRFFGGETGTGDLTLLIVDALLAGMAASLLMRLLARRFPAIREYLERWL